MISFFDIFLLLFIGLAAGFDIRERRIPNWLVLFALTGGILLHSYQGVSSLLQSLGGLGFGIGVFLIPFVLGWLGAGDVKLLGAVGAVLGAPMMPRVTFYVVLIGGLLALITLPLRGVSLQAFTSMWRDIRLLLLSRGTILPEAVGARSQNGTFTIPYGIAIGLGTLMALYLDPQGTWAGF